MVGQGHDVNSTKDTYGIESYGQAQTAEEIRAELIAGGEEKYGPFFGPLMGQVNALLYTDDRVDAQAHQLAQSTMTRQPPGAPSVHYEGIPHQQLYDSVQNGVDPGAVGATGDMWVQAGNDLTTFGDTVASAIADSEWEWEGEAANQARHAIAGMANKAGEAGQASQLAGTVTIQQADALATARSKVPPPPNPPYDPAAAAAQMQTITDPAQYSQQIEANHEAEAAQKAAHREAAEGVRGYDQTLSASASTAPAFAPPPPSTKDSGDGKTDNPTWSTNDPRTSTGDVDRPGGGVSDGRGTGDSGSDGPGGTSRTPTVLPPGGGTDTSGAGPKPVGPITGYQPGGTNTPGGTSPYPPGMAPVGPWNSSQGGRGPTTGIGRGTSGPGGPGGRPGGPGSGGPGTGGPGSGRVGGPGGPGSGSGGPGQPGAGPRAGAGHLGAGAAGAAGAASAGGGSGRAGTGGMGAGMGGGRGAGGGEDEEHQRPSYLVQPDPDGTFGTDQVTAPPVIGE